jgi:hypothetical protein
MRMNKEDNDIKESREKVSNKDKEQIKQSSI